MTENNNMLETLSLHCYTYHEVAIINSLHDLWFFLQLVSFNCKLMTPAVSVLWNHLQMGRSRDIVLRKIFPDFHQL